MPYDRALADRIRHGLAHLPSVREVDMFGGLSFLVSDRIAVTADRHGGLLVRCDPERTEDLLGRPGVQRARIGRRTMSEGWLRIATDEAGLAGWLDEALAYNAKETGQ